MLFGYQLSAEKRVEEVEGRVEEVEEREEVQQSVFDEMKCGRVLQLLTACAFIDDSFPSLIGPDYNRQQ